MLKDIHRPEVKNIVLAAVKEPNEESGTMEWHVYLVNLNDEVIRGVLVSSKGYGELDGKEVKTSILRHLIGNVDPQDYARIEMIMDNLFGLSNEYWVSFYMGSDMYDKKYIFLPESIKEENFTNIPVLNKRGVMLR
ncbi:MAG: hypothetical protein ACO1G7_11675 [Bacteroidota bacterium]|jgi:hypothetical protein|uniref:hypothetical protein n=1 Tax=Candidatus Pollutiaquabacter sp. TaxID=3416354 RepID=UPI001A578C7E|nr:hypothetical protein [Bacteroidota bacterium]MBL7949867.1 hypothetical protein [Bacteroidia bacterium]MBP7436374.1 hypothetical protein [Bacteroidia bacterium]MBP7728703.1 hypothetical protein [Bacteroidia bacterium]MBP7772759.1 hypothetical protein [Bacteroidia bacterium]